MREKFSKERYTPEEIKKAKEQEVEDEGRHFAKELFEEREEKEKAGNVTIPVEVLEELMDIARMGEGEISNKSQPNLKAIKHGFTKIYLKLEEYLPSEPSTEKT